MSASKVSLSTFIELLSNGNNGQFIVVALGDDLSKLLYVGKVENFCV